MSSFYNTVIATFVFGNMNAQPAKTEESGHLKSSEHILFHAGYSFLLDVYISVKVGTETSENEM